MFETKLDQYEDCVPCNGSYCINQVGFTFEGIEEDWQVILVEYFFRNRTLSTPEKSYMALFVCFASRVALL